MDGCGLEESATKNFIHFMKQKKNNKKYFITSKITKNLINNEI